MTVLLFQTDSYEREFKALVAGVVGDGVVLDRTAFYPGGGGQPCDAGRLEAGEERWEVRKVGRKEGRVVHFLDREPPPVGTPVVGFLEWERRYALMRTHTAMHILCGVIWRDYGAAVTGGNMKPLRGRMDFEFEHMRRELVSEIEEKINVEVAAARPVRVQILPRLTSPRCGSWRSRGWTCRPTAGRTWPIRPRSGLCASWTIRARGGLTNDWWWS
jgi:misacylated tRNA(Ala) deacylase